MEKNAYWQEVVGALEQHLEQLKESINQRRSRAKEEQKACEQWYKNELKSRGVDEDKILALKREIRELEGAIAAAEQRAAVKCCAMTTGISIPGWCVNPSW